MSGACGFVGGMLSFEIKPAETIGWSWKKGWRSVAIALSLGLFLGSRHFSLPKSPLRRQRALGQG
jgi:hypothetical protein